MTGAEMVLSKLAFAFALAAVLLPLQSCRGKDVIEFSSDVDAAIDIEHKWAVVSEPYVACRESPSYEAKISRNLRKGMVEMIVGERTVKVGDAFEKWLAFEDGWVPESSVGVYLNRLRAEKAAAEN